MAGRKNKLDDLLAQDVPPPPLRRGQGVMLSTTQPPDVVPAPSDGAETRSEGPQDAAAAVSATTAENAQSGKRTNAHVAATSEQKRAQTHNPENAHSRKRTNAQTHNLENAQSGNRASTSRMATDDAHVVRISQGQRLRADLMQDLKVYAAQTHRKLYQVMEEAIEQYLERHRHE